MDLSILPKYFLGSVEYERPNSLKPTNICIAFGPLEGGTRKLYYDLGFSYFTSPQILIAWRI